MLDIGAFEQESITILAHEIRSSPELTKILPADSCNKTQAQTPRQLSLLERASIILTFSDWQSVADAWHDTKLVEKVAARRRTHSQLQRHHHYRKP